MYLQKETINFILCPNCSIVLQVEAILPGPLAALQLNSTCSRSDGGTQYAFRKPPADNAGCKDSNVLRKGYCRYAKKNSDDSIGIGPCERLAGVFPDKRRGYQKGACAAGSFFRRDSDTS
jgi:hypothetical protein